MTDRLIFFGTEQFSLPSLEALLKGGFPVAAVVTKPDAPAGRGRRLTAPPIKQLAGEHRVPVLQPSRPGDIVNELKKLEPAAGVVVAYGRILPAEIISIFPQGLINAHASLLPKYRGPAPIEAAILNGDRETGVSIMQIVERLDAGPVYRQAKIPLLGREAKPELSDILSKLSAHLLASELPAILSGKLKPEPQDERRATQTKLIRKSDGQIDWRRPAEQIERQVRAYLGWPGSQATLAGSPLTITRTRAARGSGQPGQSFITARGEPAVYCGQGALVIERLKPAGRRNMTGREWLAGHPITNP